MTPRKPRGGDPTRIDFSALKPPPNLYPDDTAWERQQARYLAEQVACAKQRNLERQPSLSISDAVRRAIIHGKNLTPTRALRVVQRWHAAAATVAPVLIITGPPGCGKSVAAAWWVAETEAVWLRAERARRAYVSAWGAELEHLTAAIEGRHLVLEDVGIERDPQSCCELLVEVLEQRQARAQRTLITTNLSRTQWLARYPDPRLRSRTGDAESKTASVAWVQVAGPDLRTRANSTTPKERRS